MGELGFFVLSVTVGSSFRYKYTKNIIFKCQSAVASSCMVWFGLYVLAQLSLSYQAEDS